MKPRATVLLAVFVLCADAAFAQPDAGAKAHGQFNFYRLSVHEGIVVREQPGGIICSPRIVHVATDEIGDSISPCGWCMASCATYVSGCTASALRWPVFGDFGEPKMYRVPVSPSVILCLGLSLFGASMQAAETTMDPTAKENCIKACNECQRACRECLMHGGCPACDKTCLTCIETCRACVAMMEYDSSLAKDMCKVCEEACEHCAAECNKCADMPHAKRCAEACKKCEDACKALAK